jgi:hypothetical protein
MIAVTGPADEGSATVPLVGYGTILKTEPASDTT